MTVPQNGLLDAGVYSPAISDGIYVLLKPLTVGTHTLQIKGSETGCPAAFPLAVDVSYTLNVMPVTTQ